MVVSLGKLKVNMSPDSWDLSRTKVVINSIKYGISYEINVPRTRAKMVSWHWHNCQTQFYCDDYSWTIFFLGHTYRMILS